MGCAHPQHEDHIASVNKILQELDAFEKPTLYIFNKIDLYRKENYDDFLEDDVKKEIEGELKENLENNFKQPSLFISAINKEGVPELRTKLTELIEEQYAIRYPYQTKHW